MIGPIWVNSNNFVWER